MIKAVAHAVALAEVLGLCLREQLVTHAAHFKFQSLIDDTYCIDFRSQFRSQQYIPVLYFSRLKRRKSRRRSLLQMLTEEER